MIEVSVLTPFYDESMEFLERNVHSVHKARVVAQTENIKVEQIIIVDSNDPKQKFIAQRFADKYDFIFVVYNNGNFGLPASRNRGLNVARGEFIMLLDADDMMTEGRILYQVNFMREHGLDHSYGGYREIHGNSAPFKESLEPIIPPEEPKEYLLNLNNVCYCGSNCFRRDLVAKIGMFDGKLTGLGSEDLEFWIRIAKGGFRQKGIPKVLYYLGVHGSNMTGRYMREGKFEKSYEYIKQKHGLE